MSSFLSNASSNLSYGGFSPGGAFIRIAWPPQLSIKSASLVLNSPFTGITALSPFLIRLTTDASTAPVPEVVSSTMSFEVWKTFCVFSTIDLYNVRKSSLLWFITGACIAFMTLFGTLVGPGSITRYSMIISRETDEPAIFKLIYNAGTRNVLLNWQLEMCCVNGAPLQYSAACKASRLQRCCSIRARERVLPYRFLGRSYCGVHRKRHEADCAQAGICKGRKNLVRLRSHSSREGERTHFHFCVTDKGQQGMHRLQRLFDNRIGPQAGRRYFSQHRAVLSDPENKRRG